MTDPQIAHYPGGELAFLEHGPVDGHTVVGLHSTPGGRHSAIPALEVLSDLNLRYLTFDRPGYGLSPRRSGRSITSVTGDILAVADAAGTDQFSVIGGSGGSAYAVAVAALHPERVASVSLVVPTAPRLGDPAMGSDAWFAGVNPQMSQLHRLAIDDPARLRDALSEQKELAEDLGGIEDDLVSLHQDWGFDLREVNAPTAIWFGVQDTNAPAAHAEWLAEQLSHAALHPQEGDHTWPAVRMPEIFADLVPR